MAAGMFHFLEWDYFAKLKISGPIHFNMILGGMAMFLNVFFVHLCFFCSTFFNVLSQNLGRHRTTTKK